MQAPCSSSYLGTWLRYFHSTTRWDLSTLSLFKVGRQEIHHCHLYIRSLFIFRRLSCLTSSNTNFVPIQNFNWLEQDPQSSLAENDEHLLNPLGFAFLSRSSTKLGTYGAELLPTQQSLPWHYTLYVTCNIGASCCVIRLCWLYMHAGDSLDGTLALFELLIVQALHFS